MKKGISLLELMIGVLILGILAKLGFVFYFDQIKKTNKNLAIDVLHQNIGKMEQYYSQNGSYLQESNNSWPGNVIKSVVGVGGSAVYAISFYPSQATNANRQAYCLLATPVGNINQSDQLPLYSDRYGEISNTAPGNCSLNATTTPTLCPAGGAFPPCSGSCTNGPYSACSGFCQGITVCGGGCSGSCIGSIIYGSCSGSCGGKSFISGNCSGDCSNSTVCGSCSGNCAGVNKNGC